MMCHACGAAAQDRRAFGWLCAACWSSTLALVRRIIGKPSWGQA